MGSCFSNPHDSVERGARSDTYKENETTTHERVETRAASVGASAAVGENRTESSPKVPESQPPAPRKDEFTELADEEGHQGELSEPSLTFGGFLGCGSHCSVVWAIESETGRRIAVKRGRPKTTAAASLSKEARVLSQLAHPNVVSYYDFKAYPNEVCLYEEFMTGGSLKAMLKTLVGVSGGPNTTGMTEVTVRRFTVHILAALAYVHDHNVVHCDVKSSNLLLDSHGNVKLSDFGSAWEMDNSDTGPGNHGGRWDNAGMRPGMRGSTFWMAPELLSEGEICVSPAVDVWALGATIMEMLTGKPPFYHLGQIPAMARIARLQHKEGRCPLKLPEALSPQLKHFLQRIFTVDPAKRATVEQLLRHDWLLPTLDAGVSSATMPPRIPLRTGDGNLLPAKSAATAESRKPSSNVAVQDTSCDSTSTSITP